MAFTMYWYHIRGIAYRNEEHTTRPVTIDQDVSGSTPAIAAQNALIIYDCDGWCEGFPTCELVEEIHFTDEQLDYMRLMSEKAV